MILEVGEGERMESILNLAKKYFEYYQEKSHKIIQSIIKQYSSFKGYPAFFLIEIFNNPSILLNSLFSAVDFKLWKRC